MSNLNFFYVQQGYLLHLAGGKDVAQFLVSNQPFMLNALDSVGLAFVEVVLVVIITFVR